MDMQTAIFLAAVCGQTYVQFENIQQNFLLPATYRVVGSFTAAAHGSPMEPFGFLIESDRAAVLAFRGTSSATDWVTDMMAQQTAFKPVKGALQTHRGFTDVYMSARGRVFSLLEQLPSNKPLYITGHSLGGALATLAAYDIAVNRPSVRILVYTFGSPRVGDPKFVRSYNSTVPAHFRIQNEFDIVPYLPPLIYQLPKSEKIYYYLHVKGEVKRSFRIGSVGGNHILSNYFADLAKEEPAFAASLCAMPSGWCP
ncbi:lipase family protein [Paenibacillus sp. sptzw28]|uniref:lipase family protein n=1 Tax=Paenibacillus sp. sptzw28 TaxID=715179 RepID=UPI001C6E8E3B|nr:lipase family protein [Paenibacillus sp. sptzw28]QYR20870.1 lipase family protein [Paenibacillus sp. sptzw28]